MFAALLGIFFFFRDAAYFEVCNNYLGEWYVIITYWTKSASEPISQNTPLFLQIQRKGNLCDFVLFS